MNRLFMILLLIMGWHFAVIAQVSSSVIDQWIDEIPFSNPANVDSIMIWADQLESESRKIAYQRGVYYAKRLRAFYYDFSGDITKATELYLSYLKDSRDAGYLDDEVSGISDLVYTYIKIGQNDKAKSLLVQTINHTNRADISPKLLSSFYNNLGIVYSRSDQIDSAAWAYDQALLLKEEVGDEKGLSDLKINLSSLYVKLGQYRRSINLSEENLKYFRESGDSSDVIYTLINLAAGLYEIGEVKEAESKLKESVTLAENLGDRSLLQQCMLSLSSLYEKSGQFEKAFNSFLESEQIKSSLFDEQSNIRIAELRELYEAEKREQDNRLLSVEVKAQESRLRFYALGIIGLLVLLGTLALFWRSNRTKNLLLEKSNKQIQDQNRKLTELNTVKNNLMSMVSHDLSTPFSTIKVWAQGLSEHSSGKEIAETQEAILALSEHALKSIHAVLSIDKEELSRIHLSEVLIGDLVDEVITRHVLVASEKEIQLSASIHPKDLWLLTDESMLSSILDNLVSNAVKYSNENDSIVVNVTVDSDMAVIKVIDNGIGISIDDQKDLFGLYTQGSRAPTKGESTHGLGLAIVKRLVDELGGLISVKSKLGQGSVFTIRLPL